MYNVEKIKAKLERVTTLGIKWNPETKTHDDVELHPTVFVQDGVLKVSAEDGRGYADYYGEYRGGYPWIEPKLEQFAAAHGLFWEWQNPGCIGLYEA